MIFFRRFLISFLLGFVLNVAGYPIVQNEQFNPKNLLILLIGCVIVNLLIPEKED